MKQDYNFRFFSIHETTLHDSYDKVTNIELVTFLLFISLSLPFYLSIVFSLFIVLPNIPIFLLLHYLTPLPLYPVIGPTNMPHIIHYVTHLFLIQCKTPFSRPAIRSADASKRRRCTSRR